MLKMHPSAQARAFAKGGSFNVSSQRQNLPFWRAGTQALYAESTESCKPFLHLLIKCLKWLFDVSTHSKCDTSKLSALIQVHAQHDLTYAESAVWRVPQ